MSATPPQTAKKFSHWSTVVWCSVSLSSKLHPNQPDDSECPWHGNRTVGTQPTPLDNTQLSQFLFSESESKSNKFMFMGSSRLFAKVSQTQPRRVDAANPHKIRCPTLSDQLNDLLTCQAHCSRKHSHRTYGHQLLLLVLVRGEPPSGLDGGVCESKRGDFELDMRTTKPHPPQNWHVLVGAKLVEWELCPKPHRRYLQANRKLLRLFWDLGLTLKLKFDTTTLYQWYGWWTHWHF